MLTNTRDSHDVMTFKFILVTGRKDTPFFFFCAGAVCVHPSVHPADVAEAEAAVVHQL